MSYSLSAAPILWRAPPAPHSTSANIPDDVSLTVATCTGTLPATTCDKTGCGILQSVISVNANPQPDPQWLAGATDAARGAADIVLTKPGLSTIVSAIIGARKIFQRMTTYSKYTVAMTFRICFTFGLLTTIYNW